MKALIELESEVRSLRALCDAVLADPTDMARHRELEAMLASDPPPLQPLAGHGPVIQLVIAMAARRAYAVREAWGWPVAFNEALVQLRQALFTVDKELERLQRTLGQDGSTRH